MGVTHSNQASGTGGAGGLSSPEVRVEAQQTPTLKRLYSVDLESSFVLVSNRKVTSLKYDPDQSFMVAYGIDKQTHPKFSKKTLSYVTVLDAHQVCMALIDKNVLPKSHVQLFAASKDLDMCTTEGIKESFQAVAKRAGKDGILFFHFSGHGIKVGNEWGLAPADFNYKREAFISGDVLNSWLAEANCQAPYVIISLDCCYAGGLANELTTSAINLRSGTYVLSACTAFETSLVIGPLGHSVYAYFLSYAIRVISFAHGSLPIHEIFEECSILSRSLTSFLVSYSPDFGLKMKAMQPVLKYFDISNSIPSDVSKIKALPPQQNKFELGLSSPSVNRYAFITQHFAKMDVENGELCNLCLDWLGTMTEDGNHLHELASRGLLRDEVLDAIVCLMMWSFASIQFVEDKANIYKGSHFLLAFLYTASALDSIYHIRLNQEHMKQGLEFYLGVIEENEIDISELQQLREELNIEPKEQLSDSILPNPTLSLGTEMDPLESIKVIPQ